MKSYIYFFLILFIFGCSKISPNRESSKDRHFTYENNIIKDRKTQILEPIIIEESSSPLYILKPENRELKKIMRSFDYLIFNRINMDMLQGEEDMFFGKNIYPLLKEFIKNSKKISTLYPEADDEYKKMAKSLYKKAKVLNYIIRKRRTKYFKLQLESIIDTCNQCHSIYN